MAGCVSMDSHVTVCSGFRVSAKVYAVFMSLVFGSFYGGIVALLLTDMIPGVPNVELWAAGFGIPVAFLTLGIIGIACRCEWLLIPSMFVSGLIALLTLIAATLFFAFCFNVQADHLEYYVQDYFDIRSVSQDATNKMGFRMVCCLVGVVCLFWATIPVQMFVSLIKSFKHMQNTRVHYDIEPFIPREKTVANTEVETSA